MIKEYETFTEQVSWSVEDKKTIWEKGNHITGYEPNEWRRDKYGNEIKWEDYGNKKSKYGWEIGQVNLISNGVVNSIVNLHPLHWKNI